MGGKRPKKSYKRSGKAQELTGQVFIDHFGPNEAQGMARLVRLYPGEKEGVLASIGLRHGRRLISA